MHRNWSNLWLRHPLVWQWIHAVKSKNVTFEFINHVFCANRLSHDTSTHFPIVNISRTKVSSIVLISDRNFRLSKCQTGQTCIMLSDLTWLSVMCVNVIWRVHNNSIIYLQHSRSRLWNNLPEVGTTQEVHGCSVGRLVARRPPNNVAWVWFPAGDLIPVPQVRRAFHLLFELPSIFGWGC